RPLRPPRPRLRRRLPRRTPPTCACAWIVPFASECAERTGGACASFALPGIRGGYAAVDVDDISGRFVRTRADEERDRLGDVLGENGDPELRAALVVRLQLRLAYALGAGALGLPIGGPDARPLDHRVGVHGVDANPVRAALLGEAAPEVEGGRLRGRIRGGVRPCDQRFLRADEDDRAAAALLDQDAERLPRGEEVAAGEHGVALLPVVERGLGD